MAKITAKTPLLFHSKLVCVSLLYLSTTVFLAIRHSFSSTKCLFRSSPSDPILTPLFSYPPSYAEHKYAIPTHRSSCSSPVFFPDYAVALRKIQESCENFSAFSPALNYIQRNGETFGGNLSTQQRISYFDIPTDTVEVPCGFFTKFPISDSEQIAMDNCKNVVVVSAIFNDHDKIRQPIGIGTKTLEKVCFFMFVDDVTMKELHRHRLLPQRNSSEKKIGVWKIVEVSSKNLYLNPAMNGVIPKHLVHRLFPNSKFSIWVDAKLQLMVDPLILIHSLVLSENVDIAMSKHPFFLHTMEEAMATARWKKWRDVNAITMQMETYCENGLQPWNPNKLPYPTDVPDSGLILRKHGVGSNLFSCLLFNELEAFNHRDQLAFAYVRDKMRPKTKMNMFEVEVFEQIAVEYRHNLKGTGRDEGGIGTKRAKYHLFGNETDSSKCHKYLLDMWGE